MNFNFFSFFALVYLSINTCIALEPIKLSPAYQTYLWGGNKIATQYNREGLPNCVAESWELSDRPEGMTMVQTGPFAGHSLKEWIQSQGIDRLPILIKIIDAKKDLSVQVHPNDTMAIVLNSEAKSESWYALDDGFVYAGFNQNVTPEQVKDAILTDTLESLLQRIEMKKGDMIHIPGGTVHAIGSGSFILEIQQNSNTTYRLYDWGRVGTDGKSRPLHIEEGLAALDWENIYVQKTDAVLEEQSLQYRIEHLLETPYYIIRKITINGEYVPRDSSNFLSYFCEEGKGVLYSDEGENSIQAGESFILPAESVGVHISGNLKLVEVRIPKE